MVKLIFFGKANLKKYFFPNCLSVFDHFVKLALKGLTGHLWEVSVLFSRIVDVYL